MKRPGEAVCSLRMHVTEADIEVAIRTRHATDYQGAIGFFLRLALRELDLYTGGAEPLGRRKVRQRWGSHEYEITARAKYDADNLPADSRGRADYEASLQLRTEAP